MCPWAIKQILGIYWNGFMILRVIMENDYISLTSIQPAR